MKRVSIKCRLCNGTGRVEEFTCPCCLGSGTFEKPVCPERPKHGNLFNTTPEYAMSKKRRFKARCQRNTVVIGILQLSDFHIESDEIEEA